ncbi:MAG: sulfatase-like hydrolase/transferase [Verrucomicrobiota bacterium]
MKLVITLFLSTLLSTLNAKVPNLIVIITDDQGWADVGFNGSTEIPTPHIDRIANEGARCQAGYVSFPVCGPSRAGLLTGRYQDRFGFCHNPSIKPEHKAGIPASEENIAEILGKVGYHSGIIGKWHMGTHETMRPLKRGFNEFFGFLSGGHDYFCEDLNLQDLSEVKEYGDWYRTKILRNNERIDTQGYLTDLLSQEAVSFVQRNAAKPFFLYLAYNAPHTPMQATEKYLSRFKHIENKKRRTYCAMVSAVDDGVGLLLDKLDELDLAKDTLIFFLSDNGGATSNASLNKPLRGHKGSTYEGGIRVPFAVRWTGTIPAKLDYQEAVSSLDILATMAALTKVPIAPERPLDGVNLIPHFTGEKEGPPHTELFWRKARSQELTILRPPEKLISKAHDEETELYNLNKDRSETQNLAKKNSNLVKTLSKQADSWNSQLQDPAFPGLSAWLKKTKKKQ